MCAYPTLIIIIKQGRVRQFSSQGKYRMFSVVQRLCCAFRV